MKPLRWLSSSYKRLTEFPRLARRQAGHQLKKLQEGEEPADWKPMSTVGPGVAELRIHDPHKHRVLYVAKFAEAIYVLHAFEKKTQKTSQKNIKIARKAYAEIQTMQRKDG